MAEGTADKPTEAPEKTGQAEEAPPVLDAEEMVREAVDAEKPEGAAADAKAAPEGAGDEEVIDTEGADSTTMATDPVIAAFNADPRFKGHSFKSGQEALDSIANLRSAVGRVDEDRALGRQYREHGETFRQFLASQQPEQKPKRAFDPPPLPVGWDQEALKPEAERDSEKVRKFNERQRYKDEFWGKVTDDPDTHLLGGYVMPAVERMVHEMFAQRERIATVRAELLKDEAFVETHGPEIQALAREMPVERALELVQLRHKQKPQKAAEARDADAAQLATETAGPTHGPSRVKELPGGEPENPHDAEAMARAALGRRPLDL